MDEYDAERIALNEAGRVARELRRELTYEVERLSWRLDDLEAELAELRRREVTT